MEVPDWAEKAVSVATIYASERPPVSSAKHDQVHIPLKLGGTLTLFRDESLGEHDGFYAMVRDRDGSVIRSVETLASLGELQGFLYEYEVGQKNATSKS